MKKINNRKGRSPSRASHHPIENRITAVDGVRTVAILAVLAVHLDGFYIIKRSAAPWLHAIWTKIHLTGGYGVPIFFVVSGFVITRLLDSRPGGLFKPSLSDFYSRRAGRLLPLLILVCLFGQVILFWNPVISPAFQHCFKDPVGASFSPLLSISIAAFWSNWYQIIADHRSWANGMNWSVLWSLSVEEQFYFFYPLFLRRLRNEDDLFYCLVGVIIFCFFASFYLTVTFPTYPDIGRNSFGGFYLIAMGCLLYLISKRFKPFLADHPKICAFIAFSGLALFLWAYFRPAPSSDYLWMILGNPCVASGVFLFLLGGIHLRFLKSSLWKWPTLPGQLSYGEYLLHSTLIYFLYPFLADLNEFLAYFFLIAMVTFVAWISYRFFEVPANLWVRRLLTAETR